MRQISVILLCFAVVAAVSTGVANLSLPDRDAPESVLGTAASMWEFVTWLVQLGDDCMALAHEVLRYLEVGSEYIERLTGAMETGKDIVNTTVERHAPPERV
ncbi:hypothetical protein ABH15_04635 [Methanoculleus taiwanensis]|uniref:Uncharacterized protein n=1 Tax=Methanoculleus taiwanensis TaxID=1550565 RepID=A0A498H5Q9_9EURY|nr:hypothetical protein [Methanoculleus taiwanensis]RXE57375.1 hypothetical protein ABH15_04635 [Methanoculleus taiwanensis]